ncbi:unnamed protein product [Dovyalis caffra]|uniref:Uncharacterized protein n=1 Tax=Dovyalis caffra TaxID=77055 RepID=A0AAV1R6B9_9ROSI|nr:unnamed protein product [Dovyalis caffra]
MDAVIHYHQDAGNQEGSVATDNKRTKSVMTVFLDSIGAQEFFSSEMWRATFTELVATSCLLFTLNISIVSSFESTTAEPKFLIPFAIFTIAFFFLLTAVPLSGGHMSPVFTFIAALKGVITPVRASFYAMAQCVGSIVAYLVVKSVMGKNVEEKYSLGDCMIDGNWELKSPGIEFLLEFSCTFVVLFVGVTVAFDKRRCKELGLPLVCGILAGAIALASFVSIFVTGRAGYAGVGLNPARCLGPALLKGGQLWYGLWVFWMGPFVACIAYHDFTLTLPREGMVRRSSNHNKKEEEEEHINTRKQQANPLKLDGLIERERVQRGSHKKHRRKRWLDMQGLFRMKKPSTVEIESKPVPPNQCMCPTSYYHFSLTLSLAEMIKNEEGKNQVTSREILGFEDLFSLTVWRASVAELLGTAVLVFALDTIVISTIETQTKMPNLILSCLAAIIITILLLATFPISGGHINPIITFAAFLTGLISLSKTFIYILAQCLGAIFGALALKAVVNSEIEKTFSLGGCTLSIVAPGPHGPTVIGLETSQALWLEIICGFIFLFASVWMAFDHRQAKGLGRVTVFVIIGIVLGLLVFISTTVTATKGYAGAGLNPARCLGPAIVRGGHLWNGHWVFWVGPAIACVAFAMYTKIIPRELSHNVE